MCNPASLWLTKDREYWSRTTDRHEEIIAEHGLVQDVTGQPTGVRVEITPPNGTDYDAPLPSWVFHVDQDMLPEWWDAADGERRTRLALEDWAKAKLVRPGDIRTIRDGDYVVAVCGGTVQAVRGGTVQEVCGGLVRLFASFSLRIHGQMSVVVDCTGDRAVCHVGEDTERTVSSQ